MSIIYNPKDVFIVQRNSTSSSFEEKVLSSAPNTLFFFDSASNVVALPSSSISAGVAVSSSYATSASHADHANTASFAINSPASVSSSHAVQSDSASYLNRGANIYLSQSYIIADVSSSAPAHAEGILYWDSEAHTYAIHSDKIDTHLQIGQENWVRVQASGSILNGQAVYVSDANNIDAIPIVNLAVADGSGSKSIVVGLATHDFVDGEQGIVTIAGILHNFNTLQFDPGDTLYLSTGSLGEVTNVIPSFPNEIVTVGTVLTIHPTLGHILVNVIGQLEDSDHNLLGNLQGGTTSQYYHLTSTEYGNTGSGVFVRVSGSVITGSISNADTASLAITASWALNSPAAISASHAVQTDSASFINPGATLYVVSSSTNPSYIEPFNIPTVPYNPPYKEGRMFYDKDYSNWVYYTDQNFKLHIGKEVIWRVFNATAGTLTTGTPVYLSGSTNVADPDVWPGIADGTNRYSDIVGVIRYDTPSGSTGYVMQAGVIHNIDMTGFTLADPIFLSQDTLGGLTKVEPQQPYESVRLGNCQAGGATGSLIISPIFKLPPVIAYSGMTTVPTITSDGSGSIYVTSGSVNLYSNSSGFGGVLGYSVSAETMSLISGSTNYIVVEVSQSLGRYRITTDASEVNDTTILDVAILDIYNETTSSWDVHQFNVGIEGLALANRINNKDTRLYGYQRENGLTLYTTGSSGSFGITEGVVWYGSNDHTINTFETLLPSSTLYLFRSTSSNGTASWQQTTASIYVNNYYDSGSSSLVPLTTNSWSVNFVYRFVAGNGVDEDAAIVMSSEQFATELEASNNATVPDNLPSTIRDVGLLVGRFIVKSGSYVDTVVESAFTNIFLPAVVTDHESLLGLQGGTGGQHQHLTDAEYADFQNATGTGIYVRATSSVLLTAVVSGSLFGTASHAVSSSHAVSASWAPDQTVTVVSASWASSSLSASYLTAGTYQITSSWADNATTASYAVTSSWTDRASTASYALGIPAIKSGVIAGASFAGNPKITTITFTKSFADNNYSVVVTGEASRTWTIQSKVSGSFVVNSNNNTAFASNVFWQAVAAGEYYS